MIFSFKDDIDVNLQLWNSILKRLPDHYSYPDRAFLETLDPALISKGYILKKDSFLAQFENIDDSLWKRLIVGLPEHYIIPDAAMIKRQLEVL
ncbi:hypothetical protein D3C76_100230 [compost metagenome]